MSLASHCRLLPYAALLVLLLVCFCPCFAAAQASPDMPVITRISGCSDVDNVTWNCSLTADTLTIYGTNFPQDNSTWVLVGYSAECWVYYPVHSTYFTCDLYSGRNVFVPGYVLEPVLVGFPSLHPHPLQSYETGFTGVAFVALPFPRLLRISGCDDSNNANGRWTQNCDPTTATLTLTGNDFSIYDEAVSGLPHDHLRISIGNSKNSISWVLVDEQTIVIPLWESYNRLITPDHYTGTALNLYLEVGVQTTNSLSISFVYPIPPPQIGWLSSDQFWASDIPCRSSTGFSLGGCVPGVSWITISGHHFYEPITVTVAGQPCVIGAFWTTQFQCLLPLLDHYVPGFYYDLVINDTVYADDPEIGVVKGAIAFVPGPILNGMVPCIDIMSQQRIFYGKCQPGQQLTLIGTDFLPVDPQAYVTLNGDDFSGRCTELTILDDQHLVCTLPDLGPTSQWAHTLVTLYANGNTSTSLVLYPYEAANPIVVTALEGCGGSGQSTLVNGIPVLSGCLPGSDFTIKGTNLPTDNGAYVNAVSTGTLSASCRWSSGTDWYCTLPDFSLYTEFGVTTYFNIWFYTYSNPFGIVFTLPGSGGASSSSSSSSGSSLPPVIVTGSSSSSSSASSGNSSLSSTSSRSTGGGSNTVSSSSSSSGSSGSSGSAASNSSSSSTSSSSSSGLSHGAVAGIVIGAVVGAVLIVAVLVWLCRSRSSYKRDTAYETDTYEASTRRTMETDSVELH